MKRTPNQIKESWIGLITLLVLVLIMWTCTHKLNRIDRQEKEEIEMLKSMQEAWKEGGVH